MNMFKNQNCPECRSSLVDDTHKGEIICSGCGVVVADQIADTGSETTAVTLEDKMRLARATGSTTYAQHDLGITTEIFIGSKDFNGKTIAPKVVNRMSYLRKWQKRIRVASSEERRLLTVLSTMGEACEALNLSRNVLETASILYRNMNEYEVKGRSVVGITAATLYMACKQCNVVRTLEEICKELCPLKTLKTKTKLAAKYYRTMVMEMGSQTAPVLTMDKYISKIANMTYTEVRVERLALELAEKTKNDSITDGKAPNGVAAAYLCIASILLGQKVMQQDISSFSGVTESTVRSRCKEILADYKLKITLRPSLTKD